MDKHDDDLPPLGEGEILAGKYRVERVLGVGGVGVVVAAVHVALGQRVALKFLRKSAARDTASIERFLREARAVVRLKSQHAIRVQDVGTLESGEPYMVMELLEGCDFAALLAERGTIPPVEAVTYVLQACEALAEAHAAGIIHRDLKPENLFLTQGVDHLPLVKVLDFGLVKEVRADAEPSEKSLTGALVMGTPQYMSPEQIKATRDVDARADIWSIGVVLYELVSGRMPFAGETTADLIASIVRDAPPPLSAIAPDVPEGLASVIARCLEKDPAKRFTKISKLAAELDPFAAPASSSAGARLGLVQPSNAPPPTPPVAWRPATADPIKAKPLAASSAQTLDEISTNVVQDEKRTGLWVAAAVGGALLVALVYALARPSASASDSPVIVAPHEPSAAISSIAPASASAAGAASSAVPSSSASPHVPATSDRSQGLAPTSNSTSKGPRPKGPSGGKDASVDEGHLLDTR